MSGAASATPRRCRPARPPTGPAPGCSASSRRRRTGTRRRRTALRLAARPRRSQPWLHLDRVQAAGERMVAGDHHPGQRGRSLVARGVEGTLGRVVAVQAVEVGAQQGGVGGEPQRVAVVQCDRPVARRAGGHRRHLVVLRRMTAGVARRRAWRGAARSRPGLHALRGHAHVDIPMVSWGEILQRPPERALRGCQPASDGIAPIRPTHRAAASIARSGPPTR